MTTKIINNKRNLGIACSGCLHIGLSENLIMVQGTYGSNYSWNSYY